MNARDYIQEQNNRLAAMRANMARECLIITSDLSALVRLRINTRGEDFTGAKFSPYSPGYAKYREKRGRQTAFVDFNFTGQLQANTRPEIIAQTETTVTVEVTARDRLNQAKLVGAFTRPRSSPRGNILLPSKSEIAAANAANIQRIQKYIVP